MQQRHIGGGQFHVRTVLSLGQELRLPVEQETGLGPTAGVAAFKQIKMHWP
jgi:hypothetical protein